MFNTESEEVIGKVANRGQEMALCDSGEKKKGRREAKAKRKLDRVRHRDRECAVLRGGERVVL